MKKIRRWLLMFAVIITLMVRVDGLKATSLIFGRTTSTTPSPSPSSTTTASTTTAAPTEEEAVTEPAEVVVTKPPLTGIPQIDYVWDPNLPRELNGFNLSSYPFLDSVPTEEDIAFKCDPKLHDGFYASIKFNCQLYHHCIHGIRYDFLCANFTAFDQKTFICQFTSEVDCKNSAKYWFRNDQLYKATTARPTTTVAPPPTAARPVKPLRRPLRRRRPAVDDYYYDDEYDEDEYYEERNRRRKNRPRNRKPAYDDYADDERFDRRPSTSDRDRDRVRERERDRDEDVDYDRRTYNRQKNRNKNNEDDRRPVKDDRRNIDDDRRPVKDDRRNIDDDRRPLKDDRRNIDDDRRPVKDDRRNIDDDRRPVKDDRRNVDDDRRPLKDDRRNLDDERRPLKDRRNPEEDRRPIPNERRYNNERKTGERRPAAVDDRRTTSAEPRRPLNDDRRSFPDDDRRSTVSDDRRSTPIVDDRKPLNDKRNYDDDDRRPLTKEDRKQINEKRNYNDDRRSSNDQEYSLKRPYDNRDNEYKRPSKNEDIVTVRPSGSGIYDRPRAAPKIARPVPLNEKNKYAYSNADDSKRRKPQNEEDDIEYYDEYEDEPKKDAVPEKRMTDEKSRIAEIASVEDTKEKPLKDDSTRLNTDADVVYYDDIIIPKEDLKPKKNPDTYDRYNNRGNTSPLLNSRQSEKNILNKPKLVSRPAARPQYDDIIDEDEEVKPVIKPLSSVRDKPLVNIYSNFKNKQTSSGDSRKQSAASYDVKEDEEDNRKDVRPPLRSAKRPFLPSRGGSPYLPRGLQPVGVARQLETNNKPIDSAIPKSIPAETRTTNRPDNDFVKSTLDQIYDEYDVTLNDALNPTLKPLSPSRNSPVGFSVANNQNRYDQRNRFVQTDDTEFVPFEPSFSPTETRRTAVRPPFSATQARHPISGYEYTDSDYEY